VLASPFAGTRTSDVGVVHAGQLDVAELAAAVGQDRPAPRLQALDQLAPGVAGGAAAPPRAGSHEVGQRVTEPGGEVVVGAEHGHRPQPGAEAAQSLQDRAQPGRLAEHVAGQHHQVDRLAGQPLQERHPAGVGRRHVQVRQVQHGQRGLAGAEGLDPLPAQPVPVPLDQDAVADAGRPGRGHAGGQPRDVGDGSGHAWRSWDGSCGMNEDCSCRLGPCSSTTCSRRCSRP
jgi:hypothetical protein